MKKFLIVVALITLITTLVICIACSNPNASKDDSNDLTGPIDYYGTSDKVELYIECRDTLIKDAGYPYKWSGRDLSKWNLRELEPSWQWIDNYDRWIFWPVQIDDDTLIVNRREGNRSFLEEWRYSDGLVKVTYIGELPEK